ncbi:MAG: universal stress protein [Actinomycetota bacterium]
MRHEVVVGYDSSRAGRAALTWAVREAKERLLDLTVCHAWSVPQPSVDRDLEHAARTTATNTLDEGALLARQELPPLRVRPLLVRGPAGLVLARTSRDAAMLVVGTGGTVDLTGRGSVPAVSYTATHARCPVVLVRDAPLPKDGSVVVAVAGTPDLGALAFAYEHAAAAGADLHVWGGCWPGPAGTALERRWFADSLARWRDKHPDVLVTVDLADQRPLADRLNAVPDVRLIVVNSPACLEDALLSHRSAPVAVTR